MFLVVAFVLLLVLPSPWNVIGFVAGLLLFVPEVGFWNRRVRHKPVESGAETLIGAKAVVVSPLRPTGQVRIDGEIWEARCEAGAGTGERVRVTGRKRLTLVVEPVAQPQG